MGHPMKQLLAAAAAILTLCTGAHANSYGSSSHLPDSYNCGAACGDYTGVLQQATSSYSSCVNTIGASCGSDGAKTIDDVCMYAAITIQQCYQCSTKQSPNGGSSSIPGLGPAGLSGSALSLLEAWQKTCATFEATGTNPAAAYQCWLSVPKGAGSCVTGGGGSGDSGSMASGPPSASGLSQPASSGTSSPPASTPNSASQAGASTTPAASKPSQSAKSAQTSTPTPGSAGQLGLKLDSVILALGASISWLFL